jgi:transposase
VAQEAPETTILAEDEASLYLQASAMSVFAPIGQTPLIWVDPGRTKTSFYGALNLQTGQEIALQAEKMNAATTAQYLQQLLAMIPQGPILMLWDHAPWHRGAPIRAILDENPRLEVMLLPVAAPDLNPQEQVWKATRRAVSHNHTQKRLPDLASRFEEHLVSHTFQSSLLDTHGYKDICPMFI